MKVARLIDGKGLLMRFPNRAPASRTLPYSDRASVCRPESACLVKGSRRMAVLNKMVHTRVKALYLSSAIVCVTFGRWLKRAHLRDAEPGFVELSGGLQSVLCRWSMS